MRRYFVTGIGLNQRQITVVNQLIKSEGLHNHIKLAAKPYQNVTSVSKIKLEKEHFDFATSSVYQALFGEKGRSLFCEQSHEICALKFGKIKKTCFNTDPSKCREKKPDAIISFYIAKEDFRIGGRMGRYSLPVKIPGNICKSDIDVSKFVLNTIYQIEKSDVWIDKNRKANLNHLLLPLVNFKSVERDRIINYINSFDEYIEYADQLSSRIKKSGTKIIDDNKLEYSADKYHRFPSSSVGKVDWLNAHYRHGFPFDNRHHYDVTDKDSKRIKNLQMFDLVKNKEDKFSATHLNIFPNGEIQCPNE